MAIERDSITIYRVIIPATEEEYEQIDDCRLGLADWENEIDFDGDNITYDHFEEYSEATHLEAEIMEQLHAIREK